MTKLYMLSILLLISSALSAQCPGELTFVNTIAAAGAPRALAYSPDGNYLTAVYLATDLITTYAVNTSSGTLSAPMTIVGNRGSYVEYSPSGEFVVSSSSALNQLSIYSVNSVTGALALITNFGGVPETSFPNFVAFTPDSQFITVNNQTSPNGEVSVYSIDQITGVPTFVGTFAGSPILAGSVPLDYSPDGQFLAVGYLNGGAGTLRIFSVNTSTGALMQVPSSDVATSAQPDFLRYSPDGRFAAVANKLSNIVDVYSVNPTTGIFTLVQSATALPQASSLSYAPDGQFLVVSSGTTATVRVFAVNTDTGFLTFLQDIATASGSESVVYSPLGNAVAVADESTNSVTAYSTETVYSATFDASPATICTGESTTLAVAITGGTEPYTVMWADIGAQSGTSPITRVVSPTTTTTYSITSIVDDNGCTITTLPADVTVTVEPVPMSAMLSGPSTACSGSSIGLSISIAGGTGPYTVVWSDGAISSGIGPVFGRTIIIGRTTTYSAAVTDANGCGPVTSNSVTVTINPQPRATLTRAPAVICLGESSTLILTINGTGPFNVVWSDGFPQTGVSSPVSRSVSPASSMSYSATVTDANGCVSTSVSTVSIFVNALPTGIITSLQPVGACAGDTAILTAVPSGASPLTVIWSDGVINSGIPSGNAVSRTVSLTAPTTYSAQIIDANGCQAMSNTITQPVNQVPAVSLAAPCSSINAGESTDLILVAEGAGPFDVTWSDGFNQTNQSSPITRNVTPAVTTNYFATVTDNNGCQKTSNTVTVTVNP